MDPLIGREDELNWLGRLYSKTGHNTCAIYGRRRVGKTTLLTEFCKDKNSFFFTASEKATKEDALASFIETMELFSGHEAGKVKSFSGALRALKEIIGEKKTVVVIDEFPYLVDSVPGSASDLQVFIDRMMSGTNIFLIVCGSSISSMKKELDGKEKPLMGRFMNRTELKPLSFVDCRKFHAELSDVENMSLYMILGGIPLYHKMTECMSLREAVIDGFLSGRPQLSEEALGIVYRELSPADDMIKILDTIARGSTVQNEISDKTGISRSQCSKYIASMEFLGIVEKKIPMANSPKRPVYRISDHLLSFYFSVIRRRPALTSGADPGVAYERMSQIIDSHLGHEFEKVCRNYFASKIPCVKIGSWWGRIDDSDTDIDIVAVATDGKIDYSVFGECKFSKWKMEMNTFETLENRSEWVKGMMNRRYVLFSKSGFDREMADYAKTGNITLATTEQMYGDTVEWRIF